MLDEFNGSWQVVLRASGRSSADSANSREHSQVRTSTPAHTTCAMSLQRPVEPTVRFKDVCPCVWVPEFSI